jgi:chemotaxis protein MotB
VSSPIRRPESDDQDVWLITYGDMITQLFAFFALLYAMLAGKGTGVYETLQKYQSQFFTEMNQGFERAGAFPQGRGDPGILTGAGNRILARDLVEFAQRVPGGAQVERIGDTIRITLGSDILFDLGQADLRDAARGALSGLAGILRDQPGDVIVAGHTDSQPFAPDTRSPYRDNWGLSAARATNVVRFFDSQGIARERLRPVGYSDTRPRPANGRTGDDYNQWQRRVEVTLVPQSDRFAAGVASIVASEGRGSQPETLADTSSQNQPTQSLGETLGPSPGAGAAEPTP